MQAAQTMMQDILMRTKKSQGRGSAHPPLSTWAEDATRSYFRHRLASVLRSFARPSTSTHSGRHGIDL
jgi:hypothetical protein